MTFNFSLRIKVTFLMDEENEEKVRAALSLSSNMFARKSDVSSPLPFFPLFTDGLASLVVRGAFIFVLFFILCSQKWNKQQNKGMRVRVFFQHGF